MKATSEAIINGIYQIGGSALSSPEDAAVFLIDCGDQLALIDSGAGKSASQIVRNIEMAGFRPENVSHLILTHCHIDHIGAAPFFQSKFQAALIIHEADAQAVETGNRYQTAADWYNTTFPPTAMDIKLQGSEGIIPVGNDSIHWVHTPGHTPGSISVYLDRAGKRVLFGQDIHGPFHKNFGSDIDAWRRSMQTLLGLEADILCEGHFGTFQPASKVTDYIERYLEEYEL